MSNLSETLKNMSPEEVEKMKELYGKYRIKKRYAYLLWIVGGTVGWHRAYLRDFPQATILAFITIFTFGVGGVIGIADVVNINDRIEARNNEIILTIVKEVKGEWHT